MGNSVVSEAALRSRLAEIAGGMSQAEITFHTLNGARQEIERLLAEIAKETESPEPAQSPAQEPPASEFVKLVH